jgi:hypothetical protein
MCTQVVLLADVCGSVVCIATIGIAEVGIAKIGLACFHCVSRRGPYEFCTANLVCKPSTKFYVYFLKDERGEGVQHGAGAHARQTSRL